MQQCSYLIRRPDMLILASQKFEEDKGLCLGNDGENDKTDEIPYKKQN